VGIKVWFKSSSGETPERVVRKAAARWMSNESDLLYAGQRQRARILERTARGVDVNESPFAPYSTDRPYYYYPFGRVGRGVPTEAQKRAAQRMLKKLVPGMSRAEAAAAGVRLTRSGRGIRFEGGYGAFKRWLGRSTVDLRGPKAPHMLQAIMVKTPWRDTLVMGIYGEFAARAEGHNRGTAHLPRRRFFGASDQDLREMINDIRAHMAARGRRP
jgi:hypothetical protein